MSVSIIMFTNEHYNRYAGAAFFFFFLAFSSPDYESQAFKTFCKACYRVRKFKPTLSLRGLQTVLTVAAAQKALTFSEVAALTGQSYSVTSIQLAILSDGRGKQPGLKLIRRVPGDDRRQKKVILTRAGAIMAGLFIPNPEGRRVSPDDLPILRLNVLPAVRLLHKEAPNITLGTLCVLLYIIQHNQRFGFEGVPSVTISQDIGISNLPRHLENLSTGRRSREGLGFVEMISGNAHDRRVVVPRPTDKARDLMANVAATLQQKKPSPVKIAKPDALKNAASPADVDNFNDDDFDFTDIEWVPPPDTQSPE